ncbi:hypothetical protein D3981_004218 [Escherichia coli]|nr:hypothetical protein [Escherichia coli]
MKFTEDLVNAVLISNGITPVNVNETSCIALSDSFTKLTFSLYLNITHLTSFVPGYIDSMGDCPLSFDIGQEIQQVLESAHLLCDDLESLEYSSVWIELHQDESFQSLYKQSNFGLREEDIELAQTLVRSHDSKISKAGYYWQLHFDEFMKYVRNALSDLLHEVFDLMVGLRQAFLLRDKEKTIKNVTHGFDVLEISLSALNLYSLEMDLRCHSPLRTRKCAVSYIRRVRKYVDYGWQQGFITCRYSHNGQFMACSTPIFLKNMSEHNVQKRINRLISTTLCGRNNDLGLCDF